MRAQLGTFRRIFAFDMILIAVTSCAKRLSSEQKAEFQEANDAMGAWNVEYSKFKTHTRALLQEIKLLHNYLGWKDMEKILLAEQSITYIEGESEAARKTDIEIEKWSQEWNSSGKTLYSHYVSLAARSRALDAQRVKLFHQHRIIAAQQLKLLVESDTPPQLVKAFSKANSDVEDDLRSYKLDSVGLFEVPDSE